MIERRGASHVQHQQHHRQPSLRDCARFGAVFPGRLRSCTARPSLLRLNCGETRSMPMGSFVISAALLTLLKTVLGEFDYRNLDEFAEFRGRNTTREFLACEVHKRLVRRVEEGAFGYQASTSPRVVL